MEAVLTPISNQVGEPLVLRVEDAAAMLCCSKSQVYALVAANELPAVRLGKSAIRIPRAALIAWINQGGLEEETAASKQARVRAASRSRGESSQAWR